MSQKDYATQISLVLECRVTKKLSQEFIMTENRILGALSKLDALLLNSQVRVHSGAFPETSQTSNGEDQETKEDRSLKDPHPERCLWASPFTNSAQTGLPTTPTYAATFPQHKKNLVFGLNAMGLDKFWTKFRPGTIRIAEWKFFREAAILNKFQKKLRTKNHNGRFRAT